MIIVQAQSEPSLKESEFCNFEKQPEELLLDKRRNKHGVVVLELLVLTIQRLEPWQALRSRDLEF